MVALNHARTQPSSLRVMLVDDSAIARGMVRKWLETVPGLEIVRTADNGRVALDAVAETRPDIIILDLEMPVMDGLTALPGLLARAPDAKILIASSPSQRNAEITLKAMALGASDHIAKPSFAKDGNEARNAFREELIRKVVGLAGVHFDADIPAVAHPITSAQAWMPVPKPDTQFNLRSASLVPPRVLVIGASTGGPAALDQLMKRIGPEVADLPVLIAQHMPAAFTKLLGEKLCKSAQRSGGEASNGEYLQPGHIYVAPGGRHMRVRATDEGVGIELGDGPPINFCRPAVDPLFESVAAVFGNATLCVVLTGMGSDGVHGALNIADAGGTVIVQDAATSVVWGMPGTTAAAGAASAILPLASIGDRISQIIARGRTK